MIGVFALEPGSPAWRDAGRLPCANGYGVSVNIEDGFVLIGGGDAKRNFAEVWLARWNGRTVKFEAWPALPKPLAMCGGACAGRTVYVAGGLDRPDATQAQKVFFSLDLDHVKAGWRELPPWPGSERMLATAGAIGTSFYLFSGARLVAGGDGKTTREWLRDAFRFTPGAGWKAPRGSPSCGCGRASAFAVGGRRIARDRRRRRRTSQRGADCTQGFSSPSCWLTIQRTKPGIARARFRFAGDNDPDRVERPDRDRWR
jgi:N-acetylneuraminic acid mutarotase